MRDRNNIRLLHSARTEHNPFAATSEILEWLQARNQAVKVQIDQVRFSDLQGWTFEESTGNLCHESGGFFSIEGIKVNTNWGAIPHWTQPIINQPEIGFLGILAKEFEGTLMFLMQAKIEPGNVNNVQLSPTLQATRSNYKQLHGGKKPAYLDYFIHNQKYNVLLDQLQSEQGARFLKKRNRNIIIEVEEEVEMLEDFRWLTLGQITRLMQHNNVVNMDTRTVISGISFLNDPEDRIPDRFLSSNSYATEMLLSSLAERQGSYTFDELISWLTEQKVKYELDVKRINLNEVQNWQVNPECIEHEEGKFFRVIPVNVEIGNREVKRWSQPLVQPAQEGICAFIIKKIHGIYHFLVQAKLECGNFDILELAPTVQCLTGNYRGASQMKVPFLNEVLKAAPGSIRFDTYQSEEGGRFYQEQNRNLVVELKEDQQLQIPDNFIWMSLYQLKVFLKFNNYLNIQARSLIAMIDFVE